MADDMPFGTRLRHLRQRRGLSREVFGGLVGRSAEWVKAVESGRLLLPRLPLLLRMADVLELDDLGRLTGDQSLPVQSVSSGSHDRTPLVADALLTTFVPTPEHDPDLAALARRIDDGWWLWHRSPHEKSAVAAVLPGLLGETRGAARALDGDDRRRALAELSRVYSLAQMFLSWQPNAELVWLAADRALTAAQDADDPLAIAPACRYYAEVFRTCGQADRAVRVALDGAALLDPAAGGAHRARWGQLRLSAAIAEAQLGHAGDSWRHWDASREAAEALDAGDARPWERYGPPDVNAFAMRIEVSLVRPGDALRRADRLDLTAVPSRTRRATGLVTIAQAHRLRNETAGVVHMLERAHEESADSVRFSPWARQALLELSERPSTVRREALDLARRIGLAS